MAAIPPLPYTSRRSPIYCRNGAVASSQPLASEIGLRILKAGGNAVDAAVAIAAALNVTEPCSTGMGGDCFMLYYEAKTKKVHSVNGSGRAPSALTLNDVVSSLPSPTPTYVPSDSIHAITAPGAVSGWVDSIEKFGSLPLSQVLEPAAQLAAEGFPLAPVTAFFWGRGEKQLRRGPHAEELMVTDSETGVKRPPKGGEVFANPGLAAILRDIGKKGKTAFYEGRVAEEIVKVVGDLGGKLSLEDLQNHVTTFEEAIKVNYRGVDVYEVPPNGQGITALIALNMLNQVDAKEFGEQGSADHMHYMIEACRLAFADTRWFVADPAKHPVPVEELLSDAYAKERLAQIDPKVASKEVLKGSPLASCDTVSFQVVDGQGNAVSFVNSNYEGFGSGIIPKGCGFTLQNRGANFALDKAEPNVFAPNKRPYHTIIPAMAVKDGELYATFTVMGGFMQPQGHVMVMSNLLDFGMDPQATLDAARFCIADGTGNGEVSLEEGVDADVVEELKKRGHTLKSDGELVCGHMRALFGRGQVIMRDPKTHVLCAGSDGRADGMAMGW